MNVGRRPGPLEAGPRLLGVLIAATLALAPSPARGGDVIPDPELVRRIEREERDVETRVVGLRRFRVSHPQEFSGSLGALIHRKPVSWDCTTACEFRGWLVQAEPGLAGASVSAGFAVVTADMRRRKGFLADIHLGYGYKGVLMRTWDRADLRPAAQTLAGVEGDFTVIGVNFSLALLRPLGGGAAEDWVLAGGLGWGF